MSAYNPTISLEFWSELTNLPSAVSARALRTTRRMVDNPWAPELHPEKVRRAEEGVHSCRVDDSYRIIWKHIKPHDIIFCLVDKHDEAYRRASRKSFALGDGIIRVADILEVGAKPPEQHGALFGLFRREKVQPGALFVGYRDQELLNMGVPEDTLPHIRALQDVNQLPGVERLLPIDVYDQLMAIALGEVERAVVPDDELRRSLERHQGGDELCRLVDSEEFERALSGSMEQWMLFLAPHQRALVTRTYNGPARVKGVAGSGKTVVAVHRARLLAQHALSVGGKVLFLTYGSRLPGVIRHLLHRLAGEGAPELDAVECLTIHQWCYRFLTEQGRRPNVERDTLQVAVEAALGEVQPRFPGLGIWRHPPRFFRDEISYAIKGRAIQTLDQYLALDRSGRGTPLRERERRAVYAVFEAYQSYLRENGLWDFDDFVVEALRLVRPELLPARYVSAVVDEIQDLTEATMRLIRRIVVPGPNDLFLVGDGLQRIYPGGYSLNRLGIDIVGRGTLLRRNYRNTQEILRAAHAMMAELRFDDMDEGASEVPEPEFSVRRGDLPVLRRFATSEGELRWIGGEIARLKKEQGYQDRDFAPLYRWRYPYQDLIVRCLSGQLQLVELKREAESYFGAGAKHTTFDSAKGLEFKVVFVVGVTDGQFVPRDDWTLQDEELDDYMARERRRLYVAMTRARDLLYLTYSRGQPSRFLADVPGEFLQ
jgi:superfamily I DNA/RNA helicase/mRNA-degrading endonuclease RelE of RelBE toxin-antitoxin system